MTQWGVGVDDSHVWVFVRVFVWVFQLLTAALRVATDKDLSKPFSDKLASLSFMLLLDLSVLASPRLKSTELATISLKLNGEAQGLLSDLLERMLFEVENEPRMPH